MYISYCNAGTTGLLIWAVTLGALLLGGALLVYNTSALARKYICRGLGGGGNDGGGSGGGDGGGGSGGGGGGGSRWWLG
ncbi:hypothetical protein IFM89_017621 [Coptis chinensis]|uniref:Photosystem II 10 kDa polypeptide, chloroplastic n=1 Tax=Coptis chinensis TaxID=261450 RepID=A0A835GZU0_9MAGN|nr:hypothetical protein IFM89_017621 [Coptis chinensis]